MEQTMKRYANQYTNYENANYEKIKVNCSSGISKTLCDMIVIIIIWKESITKF